MWLKIEDSLGYSGSTVPKEIASTASYKSVVDGTEGRRA